MVAARVLAMLHCPVCKAGSLVVQDVRVCLNCGQHYRIVDGVPSMVADGDVDVVPSAVDSEEVSRTAIGRAAGRASHNRGCWLRCSFTSWMLSRSCTGPG